MKNNVIYGNNKKDIFISILAGVGIMIGAFLIGTFLIIIIGWFLVSLLIPSCWESCPLVVIGVAPYIGGVIAVIAGIIGGRKKYTNIKWNYTLEARMLREAKKSAKNQLPEREDET